VRDLAWAALAVALLVFLFIGEPPNQNRFWDAFFNAGHLPLFGLFSVAVLALLSSRRPRWPAVRAAWLAFGITLAVGAGTELLQFFQPDRDPSVVDFSRDFAGASAFLLAAACPLGKVVGAGWMSGRRRWLALATALVLVVLGGADLGLTAAAYVERDRAFPTLFALDGSWWEARFVEAGDTRIVAGARPAQASASVGESLARVDLHAGLYPGIRFEEPHPDWSGYRRLEFTVVSDLDVPISLSVRVDDDRAGRTDRDRFARALTIAPGVNHIVIPLDEIRRATSPRELDLSRIRQFILFGYKLTKPTHFFLGPIRLR
jgi:VanZ family protein